MSMWMWAAVWLFVVVSFLRWLVVRKQRRAREAERVRSHERAARLQDIDRGRPNLVRTPSFDRQLRLATKARDEKAFQRQRDGEPARHDPCVAVPLDPTVTAVGDSMGNSIYAESYTPPDPLLPVSSFFDGGSSGGGGAEGSWDSGSSDSSSSTESGSSSSDTGSSGGSD